jgi:hypothetical protein
MNLSRWVFIFKKKLIRLIEQIPVAKKDPNEIEMPLDVPLKISGHLLRNLSIKEFPKLVKNSLYEDARSFYLYSVIGEVLASCMCCMRVKA